MTVPGNAEWALWFVVEILFAIIWAASDAVDAAVLRHGDRDRHLRLPDLARDREGLARAGAVAAVGERSPTRILSRAGTRPRRSGVEADGGGPSTRGARARAARAARGRRRLRGARSRPPGDRIPSRLPHHRQPRRGRGRRPGRLVKAWRALGRFRAGEPWRPWLLTIVANEARNRRRSAGRRAALALARRAIAGTPRGTRPRSPGPPPEATALAADERRRLLAALDALPEDARSVLACRYLLELSEDETAAALGVRRGTVKSRTSRALERLRETYE